MMTINSLLKMAVKNNASDLHLTAGVPPAMRIYGKLVFTEMDILTPESTEFLAGEVLNEKQKTVLQQEGQIDLSLSLAQIGRFRVNVFKQRGSIGLAIRLIPYEIPSLEELCFTAYYTGSYREEQRFHLSHGTGGKRQIHYPGSHDRYNQL